MLNKIIEFSVRNKLIIILFVLALIGYGSYELSRLPIDAVPDITNNQVQIITVTPSLGAPDVERLITFPIEQANSNIPGLKEIRSFSRFGLSLVTVVFSDDIDVYWARQQVTERLQQVQTMLPPDIGTPGLAPVTTGLGEIYQYVLRPAKGYEAKYDAMELRTIQDWIVRRQLLGVEGVADVSSFGGYLKQYEVAINASKLAAYNVTVSDLFNALEKNNGNTGGAYIEKGPTVLYIRSEGLAGSIADIENMLVKRLNNGAPLLVRDLADVRIAPAVRYGAMCYNDQGEVAGAIVMMLKGENSEKVIKNIKERIETIRYTLPEGVVIEPFLDRTKMVDNAIGTVEKNLLEGSLIVIFILILFLGNIRAGLLVASIIPLSMLFAVIMMNLFGVSGNLMSLGALDFGLIVDGAVIIVEAVMHSLHSGKFKNIIRLDQGEMDAEVRTSASRMMNSAVFGQIIILIVYLPIFSLRGIEGKMFRPMAQTVAFALMGAFVLSLTYIPMMSAAIMSKRLKHTPTFSDRMMDRLGRSFKRALQVALAYPKMMIGSSVLLFVLALTILLSMGGEFIPQLEEGDFAVDTRVLTGSNLQTTIASTQKAAGILLHDFPEVQKVVTKIGSGEIPTDPMPMEASDMMVILKPKKDWTSAGSFPELAEKMSKAVSGVPGITTGFQFPVQMRFNELMTGARQDVVCKIFGEDLDTLARYAEKLGAMVSSVDGAKDLYVETVTGLPQIVIDFDRNLVSQYGLNIEDVNKVVKAAFGGQNAGIVYEGERRFDLVMRLSGDQRQDIDDVENLLIPTPSGSQLPLGQVAKVLVKQGPNQIQREDAKRRIVVGFNVRGRDVQAIVNELKAKATAIKLPPGYYITYGGAFENLIEARKRLLIVVPVALGLIFLMLYFAFRSVRHSLIIYTAIPLSAVGGAFALALRGMPFSISAGVGFIALFGVAVLNGIVLIAEFRRLKAQGLTDPREIVVKGTVTRLRPVLMTAAVASLGFLPMALSSGAGAEVQRPLATVVIGGLVSATLLTLFLLPVIFSLLEKRGLKPPAVKALIIMLFFSIPADLHAQTPISLAAAIDSARKNNLGLRAQQLGSEYYKEMTHAAWDIGKTELIAEWGNINSAYTDTRFGVTQSVSFPTVYVRQRRLAQDQSQAAQLQAGMLEKDLVRELSLLYSEINLLYQKETLLKFADSIYAEFEKKAILRFKLGGSNKLEKATAENQRGQIRLQADQLQADLAILLNRFSRIINTTELFTPQRDIFQFSAPDLTAGSIDAHPALSLSKVQKKMAEDDLSLERSRLLPGIVAGYYNQSFSGWQKVDNVERLYSGAQRFSSVQLGLGIPLFFSSGAAKIKAASFKLKSAETLQEQTRLMLNLKYRNSLVVYSKARRAVGYYELTALVNARDIFDMADLQFAHGDIGYIEYTMLLSQAIDIMARYYDELRSLNEAIIEIDYLTKN